MYAKSTGRGNTSQRMRERGPLSSGTRVQPVLLNRPESQQRRICVCHGEDVEGSKLQKLPIFPLGTFRSRVVHAQAGWHGHCTAPIQARISA